MPLDTFGQEQVVSYVQLQIVKLAQPTAFHALLALHRTFLTAVEAASLAQSQIVKLAQPTAFHALLALHRTFLTAVEAAFLQQIYVINLLDFFCLLKIFVKDVLYQTVLLVYLLQSAKHVIHQAIIL